MFTLDANERFLIGQSLRTVGPDKPIGYLPIRTLHAMGDDGVRLLADAREQGLTVLRLPKDRCCIRSGAVYVYDRTELSKVLNRYGDILDAIALDRDPDRFVEEIGATWFERTHPLKTVIAAAFGDSLPSQM